jgi:hypothetical protein
MFENEFRNRIDLALWALTQGLGIEVVSIDSDGRIAIDQDAARDIHMIRSAWPLPEMGDTSPRQDVYCARTLLSRCESQALREVPPGRLANAIRDAVANA